MSRCAETYCIIVTSVFGLLQHIFRLAAGFIAKKRFRQLIYQVTLLQASTRGHIFRKRFVHLRTTTKRPMVIRLRNIRGVPDLEHTGEVVVLVAVMGPLPKEQVRGRVPKECSEWSLIAMCLLDRSSISGICRRLF